jgi:hypothetical protein
MSVIQCTACCPLARTTAAKWAVTTPLPDPTSSVKPGMDAWIEAAS